MHNKDERQKLFRNYSSLKAIQIIEAIALSEDKVNIKDICDITGLSKSTVHRIIQDLLKCRFIKKDERKSYSLSDGFLSFYKL